MTIMTKMDLNDVFLLFVSFKERVVLENLELVSSSLFRLFFNNNFFYLKCWTSSPLLSLLYCLHKSLVSWKLIVYLADLDCILHEKEIIVGIEAISETAVIDSLHEIFIIFLGSVSKKEVLCGLCDARNEMIIFGE